MHIIRADSGHIPVIEAIYGAARRFMRENGNMHQWINGYPDRAVIGEDIEKKRSYNAMVRAFAEQTPNCSFVDVLACEKLWQKDIFVEDGVHFNQKGYHLCAEFYREALKEVLELY